MKPSALKRKRCAQLFAINRAQIHPRNAENSLPQPQGAKLDTHVLWPLLHVMLANPLFGNQVYGLPPAAASRKSGRSRPRQSPENLRKMYFPDSGNADPGGIPEEFPEEIGSPKWTIRGAPSATCRRPEGAQAPFQTRDCDRGLAGRGQSSSQSPVTLPEFHP